MKAIIQCYPPAAKLAVCRRTVIKFNFKGYVKMRIYVEKFPKIYFDSKTGKEIIEADKYFAIELITDHDKEIIQAVINKIKKEADKCFSFDSNGETPITKKALNVILNKIGKNYE